MYNSDYNNYRIFTGKSEAHKAFNSLSGIIQGIALDGKINQKEIYELERWCVKHEYLSRQNPFFDIITNIQVIISDNVVTADEIEDMKWLCQKFESEFNFYDECTAELQVLQGICHGILADGIISDDEVIQLSNWLNEHTHLASYYPYDAIIALVAEILDDGKIDEYESMILKKFFNEFVQLNDLKLQERINEEVKHVKSSGIYDKVSRIEFADHQFCFSGNSTKASKGEIAGLIEEQGGIYINSVSKKTNYLLVGDDGNPCWAYACYGRKVEKAIELRNTGATIYILHEEDFWRCLKS